MCTVPTVHKKVSFVKYNLSLQWTIGGSSAIYLFYSELWGTVVLFTYSLASAFLHSTHKMYEPAARVKYTVPVQLYSTQIVRVYSLQYQSTIHIQYGYNPTVHKSYEYTAYSMSLQPTVPVYHTYTVQVQSYSTQIV